MNRLIAVLLATSSFVLSCASSIYAREMLQTGERLQSGESLTSDNGCFSFVMQGDGNLVLYTKSEPIWDAKTTGKQGQVLIMQGDGNLVTAVFG